MAENIIDNGMFSRLGLGFLHFVVFLQSSFQQISERIPLCHVLSPSFGVLRQLAPVVIWVSDDDRIPFLIFLADTESFPNFAR